jgi:hypothetical protein
MKNKKGNVAVIALIIVIVAITAGAIGWIFAKKTQAPVQQAAVIQPVSVEKTQPATQPAVPIAQPAQQNNVYTNTEFGFQITFPNSWNNKYKAVSSGTNGISFLLPTNDKDWQDSNKTFPGYVEIYGVTVWKLADWNKELLNCKKGTVSELCGDVIVGKTSQYVITWFHPQDQPTDFAQYNSGGVEYLKQNFKALN